MGEREGRMEVKKSLHEAAILGDVRLLDQVLERDSLILHRILVGSLVHTPLHVAAFRGHLEFVRRLLSENPDLAGVLDQRRWSALHLAAAKGHRSVVKVLVEANRHMCTTLDADGRNPLHLAAINGNIDVLIELFEAQPHRIGELLGTRDANDDTVLHLAVKNLEPETVERFLLTKEAVEAKPTNNEEALNTINKCGLAPLDILDQTDKSKRKIGYAFRAAGCLTAQEIKHAKWLSKGRKSLMVVASIIATMTFQAALSAPGVRRQDNKKEHKAGENVIPSNGSTIHSIFVWSNSMSTMYSIFLWSNSMGFFGSIMTIAALLTLEPLYKTAGVPFIFGPLMVGTVGCTVVAFTFWILETSEKDSQLLTHAVDIVGWTCCMIMLVLLLGRSYFLGDMPWLTAIKTRNARKKAKKTVKEIQEQRGTAVLVQPEILTDIEVSSPPS